MLKELSAENIYIVCGHTDMRKSIDGLVAIVQQQYKLDLFSSSAFLFCGRRRDRLKVLLWEADGFILLYFTIFTLFCTVADVSVLRNQGTIKQYFTDINNRPVQDHIYPARVS